MSRERGEFYNPDSEEPLTTYDIPHDETDEVCGNCINWDSRTGHCRYDDADEDDKMELSSSSRCEFDHFWST
ncbi:MAG: hypothetical protein MJ245_01685 [Clostridia bacterium]|nr:hypothetical protein [Clostridia bacterium]